MIRALFLPDKLFSQSIVGIEVGKNNVYICQATHQNSVTKIEKFVSANIDINNEKTHEEQVLNALNQALGQINIKSDSQIRISLANNLVFFKELTVPFLDTQKIKMILGYEIESSLPFALADAVFDFVITKQDWVKKESTLVIAIAQKKVLDFYIDLIKKANTKAQLSTITVDLFNVFGLYSLLYQEQTKDYQILLELGKTSITISYLWQGRLWLVRNLPYGINSVISKIASTTKKSTKDVVESLFRFGFEPNDSYDPSSYFDKIIQDLVFTISSFQLQVEPNTVAPQLLIIESAIEIKNIAQILSNRLKITCHTLELNKISANNSIVVDPSVTITPNNLSCITTAIITPHNSEFNLLPSNCLDSKLLRYQIITIFSLTLVMFLTIYAIGYFKNRQLQNILVVYQEEAVKKLKKAFPTIEGKSLVSVIGDANTKVYNERKLWFSFSNKTRYSTLKYLQVLSNAIDMKKINLELNKLIINDTTMTIKGSVKEYDDLYALESALINVPIFKSVTKPQEKSFTIVITLKQSDRDI